MAPQGAKISFFGPWDFENFGSDLKKVGHCDFSADFGRL
jgi:hypothetical protein